MAVPLFVRGFMKYIRCHMCDGLGTYVSPYSRYGVASQCRSCYGSGQVAQAEPKDAKIKQAIEDVVETFSILLESNTMKSKQELTHKLINLYEVIVEENNSKGSGA